MAKKDISRSCITSDWIPQHAISLRASALLPSDALLPSLPCLPTLSCLPCLPTLSCLPCLALRRSLAFPSLPSDALLPSLPCLPMLSCLPLPAFRRSLAFPALPSDALLPVVGHPQGLGLVGKESSSTAASVMAVPSSDSPCRSEELSTSARISIRDLGAAAERQAAQPRARF